MKKILIISIILIAILSCSAVSAQENSTDILDITQIQDLSEEIQTENTNDKILTDEISNEILTENVTKEVLKESDKTPKIPVNEYLHSDIPDYPTFIGLHNTNISGYDRIEFYIDNIYYCDYWVADGVGTPFHPELYDYGEHIITTKYCYNDNTSVSINTTFRVVDLKIDIPNKIYANAPYYIYNPNYINWYFSTNMTGNITVYINGSEYEKKDINNKSNIIYLNDLECGVYEIKVVYTGDENHPEKTKTEIMNVDYSMRISANSDPENYYYNATVYLPKDVNNTPIATFEGKTYTFDKIESSQLKSESMFNLGMNLSELPTGRYYINITYPGDDKYPQKTFTKIIYILKLPTIDSVNVTVEYGMPIILPYILENESWVTYYYLYSNLMGDLYEYDGALNYVLDSTEIGVREFTQKITFSLTQGGPSKIITYKITIIKAPTNVTANVNNITYSEIATINITGSIDGTAIVKIYENNTKTTNITKNTTTSVTFENIPAGTYNVSVILKPTENNHYNESTYNTEFTVFKKQATIYIENDEKIVEGNTLTVNITVPNATGKIKVNGKEANLFNSKTSVKLSNLTLGNNTITVEYEGDDNNINATATAYVTVIAKEKPKIITITVDGVPYSVELVNDTGIIITNKTEPKKTSQLSDIVIGDDQSISIVLKDSDGNIIAEAPITSTVNGAVQNITTDKDGKFTVKGENGAVITINYAGDANITSCS